MIEEDTESNNIIEDIEDIKVDSDFNFESMVEEFSSINSELIKINRQLEEISGYLKAPLKNLVEIRKQQKY